MRPRITALAATALALSGLAPGAGAASRHVGPVPAKAFALLSQDFMLKVGHRAKPTISQRAAMRVAQRTGAASGPVTGISLARVRADRTNHTLRRGTLVWLVSINPKRQTRESCAHAHICHNDRMKYFVVAVDAHSGQGLVAAGD